MPVEALFKSPNAKIKTARSRAFDLDGTTSDDVMMYVTRQVKLLAARIVYSHATTGTVAAGNARIGTTVGGSEIVAATAYENAKTVGTITAMSLVITVVAAGSFISVRNTVVGATQAGEAYIELDYQLFD